MSGSGDHDEPSTVVKQTGPAVADAVLAFVVDVVEGPDKGLRFAFDSTRPSGVLVGQSAACDVRLTDRQVSRRHVELDVTDKGLRVIDLDSTNGTFVNGLRVAEAYLAGGEIVRLGETALRIVRAPSSARAEASTARAFGGSSARAPRCAASTRCASASPQSDVPVVIEGETGTGKEVLAEAIHEASARAAAPFVVFDCTAVPADARSSPRSSATRRGAFTGATATRRGVFEQADGGTLFIDEIGDLELALQPKLLRAIERGEVQRVGGERLARASTCASSRRRAAISIARSRRGASATTSSSASPSAASSCRRSAGAAATSRSSRATSGDRSPATSAPVPAGLVERLEDYAWPGNVRELQNAIARHVALGELPSSEAAPPASGGGDVVERVLAMRSPAAARPARRSSRSSSGATSSASSPSTAATSSRAAAASGIARRYFQLLKAKRSK